MSNENSSFWDKLFRSGADALNPLTIIIRFAIFLGFGFLTAFPYLIRNLNQLNSKIPDGVSLGVKAWYLFLALIETTSKGMVIGLSTLWDILLRLDIVIAEKLIGDIFYGVLVLILATLAIYTFPISTIFNFADLKKGAHYSKFWAFIFSVIIIIFIAAPLSNMWLEGDTLTSDIDSDEKEDLEQKLENSTESDELVEDETIVNGLDLLTGG